MLDKERFLQNALGLGIDAKDIYEKLDKYAEFLVDYNKKVNLTAITDAEGIENKHFIDSLLLAKCDKLMGKTVDIGSGAGFPGVIIKLFRPEISVTLMEPTGKRIDFLKLLCAQLGIKADFVKERAEEAARKIYRESFDTATARAVAPLNVLVEYALPLLKVGGIFIAMKTNPDKEIEQASAAISKLGGEYLGSENFVLPQGDERCLIFIKKISQTSPVYPRNGGKISKAPIE